jgi:methylated-DNA-[protein]-cysteine S-methyltransferase
LPSLAIDTPVGRLTLVERDGVLAQVGWRLAANGAETPLLIEAARQLYAYFARDLRDFDLPLAPAGTVEADAARTAMLAIAYGRTATYGECAARIGSNARAFGQACGANRLPIVVPCHRVLPATGFGHYSGGDGARTKSWLLAHEGAALI